MGVLREKSEEAIDFVITWVDGSDEAWRRVKESHAQRSSQDEKDKNTEARYRDIGLLKYWFRGVEKFAPWVRTVHFVTCGQKPDWLNTAHPKLHMVKHSDYMPPECLPTFNSNAIELGMHRIPGLSECFVYFNDDVFLTAPVSRNFFFRRGLPRDMYEIYALVCKDDPDNINAIQINDLGIINKHFAGRKSKLRSFSKKISPTYSIGANLRNLYNMALSGYLGFIDHHLAAAYRKQDFETIWELEETRLSKVSMNKFRTPYDLNHWIFRYRHLVTGEFEPINMKKHGRYFELHVFNQEPVEAIQSQTYKMICLNDRMEPDQVEKWTAALHAAFEAILPEKSAFEL